MNTMTMEKPALKLPKGITVKMIDVRGQLLRVAIKDGDMSKPPLLMFNGIGANLELGFSFLSALKDRRAIIFDVPGVGGSPMPALAHSSTNLKYASAL